MRKIITILMLAAATHCFGQQLKEHTDTTKCYLLVTEKASGGKAWVLEGYDVVHFFFPDFGIDPYAQMGFKPWLKSEHLFYLVEDRKNKMADNLIVWQSTPVDERRKK